MRFRDSNFLLGFVLLSLGACGGAVSAEEWERGISLERAIHAADIAAGFSDSRPSNVDVVTAKLILSNQFRASNEMLSDSYKDMESLSPPKRVWLIVYRRWPPRMENYVVVFIDASTGKTIRVYGMR
jgi:hypothetical protein